MPSPLKSALAAIRKLKGDKFHELHEEVRVALIEDLKDVLAEVREKNLPVVKQALSDLAYYSVRLMVTTDGDGRDRLTHNILHVRGILESEAAFVQLRGLMRARTTIYDILVKSIKFVRVALS